MEYRHKIGWILALLLILTGRTYSQHIDTVCPGDQGAIYGVMGDPNSYFHWDVQGGDIVLDFGDSIVVNWGPHAGSHRISVVEENQSGCYGDPVYADVLLTGGPTVDIRGQFAFCAGDSNEIWTFTTGDVVSYLWSNGSASDEVVVTTPGDISVRVTDDVGCSGWDTVNIIVYPLPVFDVGSDSTLCRLEGMFIYADDDDQGYNYTWSSDEWEVDKTGDNIQVYQWHYDQVIIVEATDNNFCSSTDTVVIFHCPDGLWEIVNVFTPNDDGIDDTWWIHGLQYYPEAEIQVFDRWGRLVFKGTGFGSDDTGWDGTDRGGRKLPMDSYHYIIDFNNPDIKTEVGIVTLVR